MAASFAALLSRLGEGFTAATGPVIKAPAGPTGRFYSPVVAGGAPFEVLVDAEGRVLGQPRRFGKLWRSPTRAWRPTAPPRCRRCRRAACARPWHPGW